MQRRILTSVLISIAVLVGLVGAIPSAAEAAARPEVDRLYCAYFLRPPDEGGRVYWNEQLDNGVSLYDVSYVFAFSKEFTLTYGGTNNRQFIELVYDQVLFREYDLEGLNYWTNKLDTGEINRGELMVLFSESKEYRALMPTIGKCKQGDTGGTTTSTTISTTTTTTSTLTEPNCTIYLNYPNAYQTPADGFIELFLKSGTECYQAYEVPYNFPHSAANLNWNNITVNGTPVASIDDTDGRILAEFVPVTPAQAASGTMVLAGDLSLTVGGTTYMTATYTGTFTYGPNAEGVNVWSRQFGSFNETFDYVVNPFAG